MTAAAVSAKRPGGLPGGYVLEQDLSTPTRPRRRRWAARWFAPLVLVLALGGFGAYVASPAVVPRVVQELPTTFVFPGPATRLPWPAAGQAAVSVAGIGEMGSFGPVATPVPIASVAKVLTAYQVLADHPLAPGQEGPAIAVTRDEVAATARQVAQNASVVSVTEGEVMSERQALQALLLASAGNVAQILAQWDAGGLDAFLGRLRVTAARLGMTHSTYTDPSGLDSATVSTAHDQLLLARAAMGVPAFAEIVAQKSAVIPVAGAIRNFNTLLGRDGVVGVKTGSTLAAGGCLMFAADAPMGGSTERVYGIVLGQPGTSSTILQHALAAAQSLVSAARSALGTATVAQSGRKVAVVRQSLHGDRPLAPGADVRVVGWPGLEYTARVTGPPSAAALTVSPAGAPDPSAGGYRVVSILK
jgi:D-alanyl-D-alanine carboxypeptidase (penicillin-binding protein 5/6)